MGDDRATLGREQRTEQRWLGYMVSHSSVLSAVEGSAFFRLDEWGTAVLGYFMAGPPASVRIWLDSAFVYCNTLSMEVQFSAEQELRLGQIASVEGVAPARLVQEAALLLIEDDERFRAGVRKGIEQADQGMFIDEAEMDARISRMLTL